MRKRQSRKRNVRNANSLHKKAEPPDVSYLSREDVLNQEKRLLKEIIRKNLENLEIVIKCTNELYVIESELDGIEKEWLDKKIQKWSDRELLNQMINKITGEIKIFQNLLNNPLTNSRGIVNLLKESIRRREAFLRGLNRNYPSIMISNTKEDPKFYFVKRAKEFALENLREKGFY